MAVVGATILAIFFVGPASVGAQYEEDTAICHQPWPEWFTATIGRHQGKTFSGIAFQKFGGIVYDYGVPKNWYKATGNIAPGRTCRGQDRR